ncbi:hypothetical protein O1611_g3517 [Lasiodiplodia mahajangana]|uniref:Uncharacterized protein n=1 Tax=Lasiodiplodia mahajangana TaxID=1108764 RepID=A0ACC2JRI2_9PEZI|nr:hypothetical protein O1611_g3517 [Lasiodiplodia mahajangana]
MQNSTHRRSDGNTHTSWRALVRQIAGQPFPNESTVATVFETRLRKILCSEVVAYLSQTLLPTFHGNSDNVTRIVHLMSLMVDLLRGRPNIHVSTAIVTLVQQGALGAAEAEDARLMNSQKKLLFIVVGWITNIYIPDTAVIDQPYKVDTEGATCFDMAEVEPDVDNRPILEIVRGLGDVLPVRDNVGDADIGESKILHVASLNIATLTRVGQVRIDWTSSISSHLDFDTACLSPETGIMQPVLKLFRLLHDWYDEHTKPAKFSTKALMQEILLSYKLLVQFDNKAKSVYRQITADLAKLEDFDPELDICALGVSRHSRQYQYYWGRRQFTRETFNASSDFPIFSCRLRKLEQFIDSIQPNKISSLWKDRRDILRWYTFWAVFALGTANLVIALVQTLLSAEQVRLAQLSGSR